MKLKSILVFLSLMAAARGALGAEPEFDVHLKCRSTVGSARALDFFLNRHGHPQFGFWYEGVGVRRDEAGARDRFIVRWYFAGGGPLEGVVHDHDGLGSWRFEMRQDPGAHSGSTMKFVATEHPRECPIPCGLTPEIYPVTCDL